MIYLDNAATTGKKPESVINAVRYSLYNLSANPGRSGHSQSQKASELVYETRKETAEMFGCGGAENVVFTSNCTHSVNIVLKGVLKKGDHIVISDMEHNAVMRPLAAVDADYSVFETSLTDDEITLKNVEKAIKDNTKMIFVTSASNVFGKALPIKEIGEIASKHGILFGVDAAQGAGVIPINMKEMKIDFLCIAPHKGLYAPMGTGILIAGKSIPKTLIEGGTGTESVSFIQPLSVPERFESGTLNLPGIAGIRAGIRFVGSRMDKIYAEEMNLIGMLYDSLSMIEGVELYSPYPDIGKYVPVLSFNLRDADSQTVALRLNSLGIAVRGGLQCAPTAHRKCGTIDRGTVRVSPGYFNTEGDIRRFVSVIKKM